MALRHALLLFAAGLAVRLCFWLATPDRCWPWSVAYQGDAPVWQQLAAGTATDVEARLPFRPPAMGWLVSLGWDGSPASAWQGRFWFALLGALVAPLLYLTLRRCFSERQARVAGWTCALANGLVLLGSGVHGEIPYLLLFLASIPDWDRLRAGPHGWAAVRWSLLQAAACLIRPEHLLCWLLLLAWLWLVRAPGRRRNTLLAAAAFALALLPWQVTAWLQVQRFNQEQAPALPLPGSLPWDAEALRALRAMPAFAQGATCAFVSDTVRARGGTRVGLADLAILEEAYACRPEPLAMPLLVLYGPLNFFLANAPEADGGFTRVPLDRRPPLAGGLSRYPPGLLQVLPRDGALALDYPPHLRAVNHGYREGLRWLLDDPGAGLVLLGRKLGYAWQGAATGLGSANLPLGLAGIRRPVDLVTPTGVLATAWRWLLLLLAAAGLWSARRTPGAAVWVVFLLVKAVTVAAFFGYARLGALTIPGLALFWALALDRLLLVRLPEPGRRRLGAGLVGLLLLAEVVRLLGPGIPRVDGVPIGPDPGPPRHGAVLVDS